MLSKFRKGLAGLIEVIRRDVLERADASNREVFTH